MNKEYPSAALERAVGEFAKLPGIGRKTALRLVLHMLSKPDEEVSTFGRVFSTLKQDIRYCKVCHNISDTDTCAICANPKPSPTTLPPDLFTTPQIVSTMLNTPLPPPSDP